MTSFTSAPIRNPLFFVGGNAIFTVVVPQSFVAEHPECRDHYTFKVKHVDANGQWPACYMAFLLTGPDNTRDYSYMGKLDGAKLKTSRKSCVSENSWPKLIFERIFANMASLDKIEAAGWLVMHEGRCCVCGRKLTHPDSIEAGIGPECGGRL